MSCQKCFLRGQSLHLDTNSGHVGSLRLERLQRVLGCRRAAAPNSLLKIPQFPFQGREFLLRGNQTGSDRIQPSDLIGDALFLQLHASKRELDARPGGAHLLHGGP
jgi:hypothetical protein